MGNNSLKSCFLPKGEWQNLATFADIFLSLQNFHNYKSLWEQLRKITSFR